MPPAAQGRRRATTAGGPGSWTRRPAGVRRVGARQRRSSTRTSPRWSRRASPAVSLPKADPDLLGAADGRSPPPSAGAAGDRRAVDRPPDRNRAGCAGRAAGRRAPARAAPRHRRGRPGRRTRHAARTRDRDLPAGSADRQVVVASAAAGIRRPVGPVETALRDPDRLERTTRALLRQGFRARVPAPRQVATINAVFTPVGRGDGRRRAGCCGCSRRGGGHRVAVDADGSIVDAATADAHIMAQDGAQRDRPSVPSRRSSSSSDTTTAADRGTAPASQRANGKIVTPAAATTCQASAGPSPSAGRARTPPAAGQVGPGEVGSPTPKAAHLLDGRSGEGTAGSRTTSTSASTSAKRRSHRSWTSRAAG